MNKTTRTRRIVTPVAALLAFALWPQADSNLVGGSTVTGHDVGAMTAARADEVSAPQQSIARKWCGPGGRLCIEDGRWTWKKKRRG